MEIIEQRWKHRALRYRFVHSPEEHEFWTERFVSHAVDLCSGAVCEALSRSTCVGDAEAVCERHVAALSLPSSAQTARGPVEKMMAEMLEDMRGAWDVEALRLALWRIVSDIFSELHDCAPFVAADADVPAFFGKLFAKHDGFLKVLARESLSGYDAH